MSRAHATKKSHDHIRHAQMNGPVKVMPLYQDELHSSERPKYFYEEGWDNMDQRVQPEDSTKRLLGKDDVSSKAKRLIEKHTNFGGLNIKEEALGKELAGIADTHPELVEAVLDQLESEDRDDVASVIVEQSGGNLAAVDTKLLRRLSKELQDGIMTPGEQFQVKLISIALGEFVNEEDISKGAGDLKPMTTEYSEDLNSRLNDPWVRLMVQGLSTVGNKLYGESFRPKEVLKLSEKEKEKIFTESSNKTLGILMSEFVEGHGLENRYFGPETPITKEIKVSYPTTLFKMALKEGIRSGAYVEGQRTSITIYTSPDNAQKNEPGLPGSKEIAAKALMEGLINTPAFFMGSLDYTFTISGDSVDVLVHNEYSIASGVTRNDNDNLFREPGHLSPLGNTHQYFTFTILLKELDKL